MWAVCFGSASSRGYFSGPCVSRLSVAPLGVPWVCVQGIINNETLGYFIGRTFLFLTRLGIDQAAPALPPAPAAPRWRTTRPTAGTRRSSARTAGWSAWGSPTDPRSTSRRTRYAPVTFAHDSPAQYCIVLYSAVLYSTLLCLAFLYFICTYGSLL